MILLINTYIASVQTLLFFEYFYLYIVDQHAHERSLYDADDVCNDI